MKWGDLSEGEECHKISKIPNQKHVVQSLANIASLHYTASKCM